MNHKMDFQKSIEKDTIYETIKYTVFGSYELRSEQDCFYVKKKDDGHKIHYEMNHDSVFFDKYGARKAAYNLNKSSILNKLRGTNSSLIKGRRNCKIL